METQTQPEAPFSEPTGIEAEVAQNLGEVELCFVDGIPASYNTAYNPPFYKAVGVNRAHRRRNAKKIERLLKVHKHQGTTPEVLSRKEYFETYGEVLYVRAVSP